jgi:hypothetical protein
MESHFSDNKNIPSLKNVLGLPSEKLVVFGVIIDATGHYKTEDSKDYITRIKIIDHSLNINSKSLCKNLESFIYVFIYTETVNEAPQIGKMGDVIKLDNFYFNVFENTPKAVFKKKYSSWTIFDGRKNANNLPVMTSHKMAKVLNEYEKSHIYKLRTWSETFFKTKSLYKMNWFKRRFPKGYNNALVSLEDVDLIVKLLVDVSVKKDKDFYQKMVFVDKKKNIYFAELKGLLTGVDKGDILKLRSIKIVKTAQEFKIEFSSYSNFMILQKYFYDAREIIQETKNTKFNQNKLINLFFEELHLEKRTKKMIGPNTYVYSTQKAQETSLKETKRSLEAIFPILKNFCYDLNLMEPIHSTSKSSRNKEEYLGSTVLNKHKELPLTDLKSLVSLLKESKSSHVNDFYRVRVKLVSIENTKFKNNFKILSSKAGKTWPIDVHDTTFPEDSKILFYNVFGMKDESLAKNDHPVHGYLITYNENPKYIFDLWRLLPDPLVIKDWLEISSERKKKFEQCIKKLISKNKEYEFIMQIIQVKGKKAYLKIVDSIFWILNQN